MCVNNLAKFVTWHCTGRESNQQPPSYTFNTPSLHHQATIDNKISLLPIWHYINFSVHLRNSNKQRLILARFYISSGSSIGSQRDKFQLNLTTQTIATAAFVKSHQKLRC